jgi:aryl-alcohol dehydrogenase-like predicted oxidoreductase
VLGRWFARSGKRDQIVLATKVGMDMGDGNIGLSRDYIARAVDASLTRLKTDRIDLYQAHTDDANTPLEETLDAFDRLIRAGKVRAIGASNYSAARLAGALDTSRANGLARYESLQPQYNLYDRTDFERELQPLCVAQGVGVINYFGLAAGFLTGKYRTEADLNKSERGPRTVRKYMTERGMRILDALDKVAEQKNSTPAAIALAWQMAQPSIVAPIASATSIVQLQALIAACSVLLNGEEIAALAAASA